MTSTRTAAQAAARPRGLPSSLAAHPAFGPLPGLLLILTAVTGVVDAVSILALGRVFVANMTGNVVFAGFAIVGAPGFSLSASLFALAGFLAGATLGGAIISRAGRDLGSLLRAGETQARAKSDLFRRLLAIAPMLAGALAGAALTLYVSPVSALALALSLLATATAGAMAAAARPAPWRTPPSEVTPSAPTPAQRTQPARGAPSPLAAHPSPSAVRQALAVARCARFLLLSARRTLPRVAIS